MRERILRMLKNDFIGGLASGHPALEKAHDGRKVILGSIERDEIGSGAAAGRRHFFLTGGGASGLKSGVFSAQPGDFSGLKIGHADRGELGQ